MNSGGALTLNNLVLSNTNSARSGGAILNKGTLTINGSEFIANFADQHGGAIYNDPAGVMSIANSTFDNNSASDTVCVRNADRRQRDWETNRCRSIGPSS